MNLVFIFWVVIALLVLGWIFCAVAFFKNLSKAHDWGERILFVGLATQLFYVVANFIEQGSIPYDSLSGLLLFGSFLVLTVYFLIDFYAPNDIFEVIIPPLSIFFLLIAELTGAHEIGSASFLQGMPVFGKTILITHISMTMLGYLLFGVACTTSIFYLYQERLIKKKKLHLGDQKLPSLGYLDNLNHRIIVAGFVLVTVGLFVGILMKLLSHQGVATVNLRQMLPLFTWAVYAVFLLDRSIKGMIGRLSAIWAILGFVVVVGSFVYEISILMASRV